MGQCGCADFAGEFTLPAPDGGLYVFWRYASCEYCDTPAGVVVCLLRSGDDIETWGAGGLPRLRIDDGERLIPVVSVESLAKAAGRESIEAIYDNGSGYETLAGYLRDSEQLLSAAVNDPEVWKGWKP